MMERHRAPNLKELKRRLDEATERLRLTTDPEERNHLGADIRELEKLVEIAADKDLDAPR